MIVGDGDGDGVFALLLLALIPAALAPHDGEELSVNQPCPRNNSAMIITASRIRRLLSSIVEWLTLSFVRVSKNDFSHFQSRQSHSAMSLFSQESVPVIQKTLDHTPPPPCSSSPYFIPSNPALRATPSSSEKKGKRKSKNQSPAEES